MSNKRLCQWTETRLLAKHIADVINTEHPGCTLITCTRGGLFVTGLVTYFLNWKPTVLSLGESTNKEIRVDRDIIFIDDILDTGRTARMIQSSLGDIPNYFLFDKPVPEREFTPKNYLASEKVSDLAWIVFPWEILHEAGF